jgi:hypothetical protein
MYLFAKIYVTHYQYHTIIINQEIIHNLKLNTIAQSNITHPILGK